MVTENNYVADGKYMGAVTHYGLSTDTKPLTVGNGSMFIEIDNVGKVEEGVAVNYQFCFDAENKTWYPVAETPAAETKSTRTSTKKSSTTAK